MVSEARLLGMEIELTGAQPSRLLL